MVTRRQSGIGVAVVCILVAGFVVWLLAAESVGSKILRRILEDPVLGIGRGETRAPVRIEDLKDPPPGPSTRPAFVLQFEQIRVVLRAVPEEINVRASGESFGRPPAGGAVQIDFRDGARGESRIIRADGQSGPTSAPVMTRARTQASSSTKRPHLVVFDHDQPVTDDWNEIRIGWVGKPNYLGFSCATHHPDQLVLFHLLNPQVTLLQDLMSPSLDSEAIKSVLQSTGLAEQAANQMIVEARKTVLSEDGNKLMTRILDFNDALLSRAVDPKTATEQAMIYSARTALELWHTVQRYRSHDMVLYLLPQGVGNSDKTGGRIVAFDATGRELWHGVFQVPKGRENGLLYDYSWVAK